MTYCFYLAPQVPDEARRLFDAAATSAGITREGIANMGGHRINAIAWFLSREWGLEELETTLRTELDANYEPNWDRTRGEFTWGLGLAEDHPRGQYNGFLAAAEAVSPGAWARLSAAPLSAQPGLVEGVDFPKLALAEARWHDDALHLRLHPQNDACLGEPTRFRITGLDDADRFCVEGEARLRSEAGDLVVETSIGDHRLTVRPATGPR
jgi:hypothetical protein